MLRYESSRTFNKCRHINAIIQVNLFISTKCQNDFFSGRKITRSEQKDCSRQAASRTLQTKIRARNVGDHKVSEKSDRKHESERKDSNLQLFPEHDHRSPTREVETDSESRSVSARVVRFRGPRYVQRKTSEDGRHRVPKRNYRKL